MEIEKFEKEFKGLKENPEITLSIIHADDIKDHENVKMIVDGKEIKDKVFCLICFEFK